MNQNDGIGTTSTFDLGTQLAELQTKYEGCLAINHEQVMRMSRAAVEIETLRARCEAQARALTAAQEKILALESGKRGVP